MTYFSRVLKRIEELIERGESQSLGVRYDANNQLVCYDCGKPLCDWNYEHLAARAVGGSNDEWNIVIACPDCNQRKRAKTPTRWFLEEKDTLSQLPDEISIDLFARLLLNLHHFMMWRNLSGLPVLMGIHDVEHIPLHDSDYKKIVTVAIGTSVEHPDFVCPKCNHTEIVQCSPGTFILRVKCPNCDNFEVYKGFPLVAQGWFIFCLKLVDTFCALKN